MILAQYNNYDPVTKKFTGDPIVPKDTYLVIDIPANIPVDYTNVSSIENWDTFRSSIGKDYKYIRKEIRGLVADFNALSAAEKKIVCKYFASGIGAEYNNGETIWTDEEQDDYMSEFDKCMRESRIRRDEAVTKVLQKKVRRGLIAQGDIEIMMLDAKQERERYRLDGHEGIAYGDVDSGYFDYLENTGDYSSLAVASVDTGTNKIITVGNNKVKFSKREFVKNDALVADKFVMRDSTANDGTYTIGTLNNIVEAGGNTEKTVNEAIGDATPDGNVYLKGFLSFEWATIALRDELMDVYANGNY